MAIVRLVVERPRQDPVLLELARSRSLGHRAAIHLRRRHRSGFKLVVGNTGLRAGFELAERKHRLPLVVDFTDYVAAAWLRQGPLCMMMDK